MRIDITIETNAGITGTDLACEVNDILRQLKTESRIATPRKRLGELAAVDGGTVELVLQLAQTGAVAAVITAALSHISERAKSAGRITIKLGTVSADIPRHAKPADVQATLDRIIEIAERIGGNVEEKAEGTEATKVDSDD